MAREETQRREHSAGALLFRQKDGVWQTLLVCALRNEWGFPKGHLEGDETPLQAAKREILEETGLTAEFSDDFCIRVSYTMPNGKNKIADYFLCDTFTGNEKAQEGEIAALKWADIDEAESLLPYAQLRHILHSAFAAQLSMAKEAAK